MILAAPLAGANGHQALSGNSFPVHQQQWFLTGDEGQVGGSKQLLLGNATPAAQGTTAFLLPGVDALGLVREPANQTWSTPVPVDKDTELTDAATVVLYFRANAQALSVFEVRLTDVAPSGEVRILAYDTQQFVTALSPQAISFFLHTQGEVIGAGHFLRVSVYAQTANAVVLLQYGGATPSGLHGLRTRWLDSDGDGVADSDETLYGSNPLDPQDPPRVGVDSDRDGLRDEFERSIGTDPRKADTDGDGFVDGLEVYAGTNPKDPASVPYDANHNGLPDTFEVRYFNSTTLQQSFTNGTGGIDLHGDPDGDGCDNLCEAIHGTDPNNPDTDGDGVPDGREAQQGTDPMNPSSLPHVPAVPEPIAAAAGFAFGTTVVFLVLLRKS